MNTQQKLPQGWVTSSLLELVLSITYGHTASATEEPIGPKFLRITDLQNGTVRWNTVPYCKCEDAAKYLLKKDDIVVARTGATTGKSYLIPSTPEKSVFASYLIRIETPEQYPVEFLALFMQSPSYWQQITVIKKGSAQPGANATALGKLRVPLAPANEQRRIADKINALQAKSKKAREGLKAARPLLDKLRQSVLASAFRGDLTADWRAKNPDVEPTSALLERIREERRRRWEEAELAKMRAKGKEPKNDK